jgi:photosynthetic reaction center H subunit
MVGAITGYIDVAQLTLYAFWIFFFCLIFYLRREDKREGYPLISERKGGVVVQGFPFLPKPKVFRLHHGGVVLAPRVETREPLLVRPMESWPGSPMVPIGDPLADGVGPAAYAMRADVPDMTWDDNLPKIVPLRVDPEFFVSSEDPDPRGMAVYGADGVGAGVVSDVWIDKSEMLVRYLEVALDVTIAPRSVLVPMTMLKIDPKLRRINVRAITGGQFAKVPALSNPDQVTLREEDRIMGYFGGGTLYALPGRTEPLL